MEIIRANGIAFLIIKSGYITRRLLKFGSEETIGIVCSTEYEAISRYRNYCFVFEITSDSEEQTHRVSGIEVKFRAKVIEHFKF